MNGERPCEQVETTGSEVRSKGCVHTPTAALTALFWEATVSATLCLTSHLIYGCSGHCRCSVNTVMGMWTVHPTLRLKFFLLCWEHKLDRPGFVGVGDQYGN